MANNRTGAVGIDGARRDFRGTVIPADLAQHLLGERIGDVRHACPECGVTYNPNLPFQVCLCIGNVYTERLDRYAYEQHQKHVNPD